MASIGTEFKNKLDNRFLEAFFDFINENTDNVILFSVFLRDHKMLLYHNEKEIELKEVITDKLAELTTLDLDDNFEITIIFKRK